ncbi:MAG: PQQ-dependent sugar dehydrogenase [Patescibacteria group bacterium]|nr:PQQ-dependent sugar dehydrogenase [Patescibacteria group bacterium]
MNNSKKILLFILILIILIIGAGSYFLTRKPQNSTINNNNNVNIDSSPQSNQKDTEIISENLDVPWEVVFLPSGAILITERPGNLFFVKNKQKIPITGVEHIGEGGLLGMAIHPNFINNQWIYLYFTTRDGDGVLTNKVERYRLEENRLIEDKIIIQGIQAAGNHDGGRIAFGPEGYLYITTGDAQNSQNAQDINSLSGKILRVTDEGDVPTDNPFKNAVYSYGHRNPQGLAWDNKNRLWATEHGRSGVESGFDELNLIEKGKNYGWPVIQGDEAQNGMVSPVIQSGPTTTWAPAGAAFYNGSIFFGGLRGEALFEFKIASRSLKKYFEGEFGRIRAVVLGPDNFLYITTSNKDGRGSTRQNDDKLIKINSNIFE